MITTTRCLPVVTFGVLIVTFSLGWWFGLNTVPLAVAITWKKMDYNVVLKLFLLDMRRV